MSSNPAALADQLFALVARTRARVSGDPFGNPVLSIAFDVMRRIESDEIDHDAVVALIRYLRDQAFSDRAARLARYVGSVDPDVNENALAEVARNVLFSGASKDKLGWDEFRAQLERTRYAAVFTGHPTFALPPQVGRHLAEHACGAMLERFESHRPLPVTLVDEFEQAAVAIANGRDALDRFNAALLSAARDAWPERWTTLVPRPLVISTWVGYDTDGRTDIGWWDTLRLRLHIKRLQLARLRTQLLEIASARPLSCRVDTALAALDLQIAACPSSPDPQRVSHFARTLIERRDEACVSSAPLLALFEDAIAQAAGSERLALCVARAGLAAHGLALAHTHVRLNATQLHNAARHRLNIVDPVDAPSHRRAMLAAINVALDKVEAVPVDFGSLLVEQATAVRMMMTVAQLVKHIDSSTPVRLLIAETESGYTLLTALWLAKLFGVERHIEISPLFETAEALEHGAHVLDEALNSAHYRAYVQLHGRIALQFGYSDSGRYVGQLAASFLIERLRLKIAQTLARHGIHGVEVVLFDTHGESIGRGAHPGSLADRLKYLSPTASRHALNDAGHPVREESAFQGGDGYLLFGTRELALATVARLAEHAFHRPVGPVDDPIYADPDFASDFFGSIRATMTELVEDAGYTAILGAFGPALLDRTGSRPAARQSDGAAARTRINHPRELRAIPNNAILQQFGWCANTLHGLGAAAARQPEVFTQMRNGSRRFRRALDFARCALTHSDIEVLRAVVSTLDPGMWLDRALHAADEDHRVALLAVASTLDRPGASAALQAMFRRALADDLALRAAWPERVGMSDRETLLHALRLALIHRIWLHATHIPEFAPRPGVTAEGLHSAIIGLDMPAVLPLLAEIFPENADHSIAFDYAEPAGPRATGPYAREHAEIFVPMSRLFDCIREISTAVTHEVGAFG
ncbi:phosphoenolpyruvate carboxylase [Paraburkholderia fungorum]|uniref:Phosphoenolpyruvate carboxylase n=1 Tax=Paraburkholderia fungorum TaxID=134537 RepID=A0A420H019_9BURK|nr:phosphoenolpyruvate carboxylase [Paraburkholderia fungorum]RKF50919.1 phosphoenolpyruvate carboxylase [Paraburkholderia fungorum]